MPVLAGMALAPSLRAPPKPGALRPLPCPKPSSTNIINMPHSQPLAQSSVLHVPAAARCSATFRQRCAVRTRVAEAPVPSTQTTSSTWSAPAGIDLAAYPSMSGRHVLITGTELCQGAATLKAFHWRFPSEACVRAHVRLACYLPGCPLTSSLASSTTEPKLARCQSCKR